MGVHKVGFNCTSLNCIYIQCNTVEGPHSFIVQITDLWDCVDNNLCHRRNLTWVGNVCKAAPISLFWSPKGFNKLITGNAFRISFHPDWQNDDGFSNTPIMASTQVWEHRWDPEKWFQHCFADGLDQSLVFSVAQAMWTTVR